MKSRSPRLSSEQPVSSTFEDWNGSREHLNSSGLPDGSEPPPVYEELVQEVNIAQEDFNASATILDDGRVNIKIDSEKGRLSSLLAPAYESGQNDIAEEKDEIVPGADIHQSLDNTQELPKPPPLNLVLQVVGSRGDVQPFIALGRVLKESHNHRVRIATHAIFKNFVEENGLEFFNIGGDPAALMAFMVKNPRLLPSIEAIKGGIISKRRKEIYEIMKGCWRSCFEAGDGMKSSHDGSLLRGPRKEFVADVIIANPPSFAHLHCAQKLGIPVHVMFTMPWSATQAFPHPLANIQPSNVDASLKNFMSYPLVEMMMWQGLGSTINMFRTKILDLEPVRIFWGPKGVSKLKIPHTYLWSPSLIPKPRDWGSHISVTGFPFLQLASQYVPDPSLEAFLAAGPVPIYVGFGSIVVDDPNAMLQLVFEAVQRSGQRALISSGWGGLDTERVPEGIFIVGNVPHDWLFARVSCVVHHGGAGTTAAGIRLGKPTIIIPFFGDQFFWGSMVARAGAGPKPIPFRELKSFKLVVAIESALSPTTQRLARELGRRIQGEKGAEWSASSLHQHLEMESLRCNLDPSRNAVWKVRRTNIRLGVFSTTVLIDAGLLRFKDLNLYRPREYDLEDGPWDPISGTISACLNMVGSMMLGFADVPLEIRRARKPKIALTTSKNGELLGPSSESSHRAGTSSSTTEYDADQSTPIEEGYISTAKSTSRSAVSLDGIESSYLYPQSISSTEDSAGPVSPPSSVVASGSNEHPRKRDYRVLRTSNGLLIGTSKALGKIMVAGFKSPFEVSLSAARGFHNVPRLYGDDTVRPHERITDIWSGLKAAGKGLTYGVYDGVSGLWMQPIEGAKKEGTIGLWKGVGKGIGGLALKPVAGTWGVVGYTFEGVNKEVQKLFGSNVESHIIASRKAQGFEDFRNATAEEKALVLDRWRDIGALI